MYILKYNLLNLYFDNCVFSGLTLCIGKGMNKKKYTAKINRTNPRKPQHNTRYNEQLRNAESGVNSFIIF